MSKPSMDAVVFGMGFVSSPKAKLTFGGDGSHYSITDRARKALDELIELGYVVTREPDDQIPNREYYVGAHVDGVSLTHVAHEMNYNPFDKTIDADWKVFVKREGDGS